MAKPEAWITVGRPAGTKIQKRGDTRYVYHVVSTHYNKDKKYNIDERKLIGKMADGSDELMIPNGNFEIYYPDAMTAANIEYPDPPEFCDTLKAGTFAVIRRAADICGITAILKDIYGSHAADEILDILAYVETAGSCTFQHYPAFMRNHLQLGTRIRSDSYLSRFMREALTDENINEFLRRWNLLHVSGEKIYVNFDGSNMNWEAADSHKYSEFGAAKDDPTRPQVNFMTAMEHKDGELLDYQSYNGSINDMSQFECMMERMRDYGYRNVGCILDRGFFFGKVIRWIDKKHYDAIMMARTDRLYVQQMIEGHYDELHNQSETQLKGLDVFGITVQKEYLGKDRYFHIYYDDVQGSYQRRRFFDEILELADELDSFVGRPLRKNSNLSKYKNWFHLEIEETQKGQANGGCAAPKKAKASRILKGYEKNAGKINRHARMPGHFCIMTTGQLGAADTLVTYRQRDIIEKFFRNIKWNDGCSTPGVHSDEAFDAKMHILFLTGIINGRLMRISREIKSETKNKRTFTIPGMVDLLEGIECTANPDGIYKRRYAITAKQRLILEKLGIQDGDIDKEINAFNSRLQSVQ